MDSRQQVEAFFRELETQIEIPLRAGTLKKKNLVELFATFGILDTAKKAMLDIVNAEDDLIKAVQEKEDAEDEVQDYKRAISNITDDLDSFINEHSMNFSDEINSELQKILRALEYAPN